MEYSYEKQNAPFNHKKFLRPSIHVLISEHKNLHLQSFLNSNFTAGLDFRSVEAAPDGVWLPRPLLARADVKVKT